MAEEVPVPAEEGKATIAAIVNRASAAIRQALAVDTISAVPALPVLVAAIPLVPLAVGDNHSLPRLASRLTH